MVVYQELRSAYRHPNQVEGRNIATKILDSFPISPIPEIARLGRTEPVNGLIELRRRGARGFHNYDNYRLRMLLIGGGLRHPHLK